MTTNDTKSMSVSHVRGEIQQRPAKNISFPRRYLCTAASDAEKLIAPWIENNPNEQTIRISKGALICVLTCIHEMQVYGQRMEDALYDYKDYEDMKEQYEAMKAEIKDYEAWKKEKKKKKGLFGK